MPDIPLVLPGEGGFFGSGPGFDLGDIVGPNSALSRLFGGGGAMGIPAFPTTTSPVPTPANGNGGGGGCGTPFRAGAGVRATAVPFVLPNPVSGRPVWFKPAGQPVLWSDDLRAVKRVKKVAAKANRSCGTRRRAGGR